MNELIKSHDPASNEVINAEEKSQHDLIKLSKEYGELTEQAKKNKDEKP